MSVRIQKCPQPRVIAIPGMRLQPVAVADAVELVFQCCWEGCVEFLYRRWGWPGAILGIVAPFVIAGGMIALFWRA